VSIPDAVTWSCSDRVAGIWFHDSETGSFPVDANNNIDFTKYIDPKPKVWTG